MAEVVDLPSNVEAECACLGACLVSSAAASIVLSSLDEESFTDPRNKDVFKAMNELVLRRQPIDATTINNELNMLKLNEEVGGLDYLLYLTDSIMNEDNVDHYINIVKDHQLLRTLLLTAKQAQKDYANGNVPNIGEFLSDFNQKVSGITNSRRVQGMKTAKEVAKTVTSNLEALQANNHNGLIGIDTGYKKLNDMTHGWRPQDLVIVAARPSMGKTALTLNLAFNSAARTKRPVAFFSLEMSAPALMNRLIANRAMVSNDHLQTGWLNKSEKLKIATAVEEINETPLYFDDTPNMKLGDVIARATAIKHEHKDLCMIVIDYLGRINISSKAGKLESREREVATITGALKQLARELDVTVMLVCQINRNAEDNAGKRPSMANLRESGSIEADADQVLLLYRPDYYTATGQSLDNGRKKSFGQGGFQQPQQQPQQDPTLKSPSPEPETSIMEVIIAKSRNGQVGSFQLIFSKQYSRFDNMSKEFEEINSQHIKAMNGGGDYLE